MYGYRDNNRWIVPVSMRSRFNGIGGWHRLTDEQRAEHGWYRFEPQNYDYDPATQVRSGPFNIRLEDGVLKADYMIGERNLEAEREAQRRGMVVSRFQALAALDEFGYLEAAEALINSDQASTRCKLAWKNALEFRRLSPMVLDMAPKLGISPEKLDEIFDYAKTVEA